MATVAQLLTTKGGEIWSVRPDTTVYEAIELMATRAVGALLVMDDSGLAGILSERDYARKVILQGRSSRETAVSEIMTTNVFCANPAQSVEDCLALMTEKRIRHLPIEEDGQVVGVVSIGDLVKVIIEEQQRTIEQLGNYISG